MTGFTSLFGLSNYYLYKESFEYFSNSILLNPFVHTWSLSLELQFYLILNLIFLSTKFKTNLKDFVLIIILISFVIASILIYLLNHEINFLSTYYLMPSRFWEFGIGCLISLIPLDNILFLRRKINKYNFSGNFINNVCPKSVFILLRIVIVLFTSIILLNLQKGCFIVKILSAKHIVNLGKKSYSLYMWHWGFLSLSYWTIGIKWWTIPFQILFIYFFSDLSYRYFENNSTYKYVFLRRYYLNLLYSFSITILSILTLGKVTGKNFYLGKVDSLEIPQIPGTSIIEKIVPNIKTWRVQINCFLKKKTLKIYYFRDSHNERLTFALNIYLKFKLKHIYTFSTCFNISCNKIHY